MGKEKGLFEILHEINQSDAENDTQLLSVSPNLLRASQVKQGTKVEMGADHKAMQDIMSGKVMAFLVLVDKDEVKKRSGDV